MLHKIFNIRIIYRNWYFGEECFGRARCLSYSARQIPSYTYPWSNPKESLNFMCLIALCVLFLWSFPINMKLHHTSFWYAFSNQNMKYHQNTKRNYCHVFFYCLRNILFFSNNPFCPFGKNVGTWESLLRSSYP